jgi:hypothetical protein
MDVFTLDSLLRRSEVFDIYDSFIWTERWQTFGDFDWTIRASEKARSLLKVGTRLAINPSRRVMTIESIEDKVDNEGKEVLILKGRSLEAILDQRVFIRDFGGTYDPNNSTHAHKYPMRWYRKPAYHLRKTFDEHLRQGLRIANDAYDYFQPIVYSPIGSIPEPANDVEILGEVESLLSMFIRVAKAYDLGFRIVRPREIHGVGQLYFEVYTGNYKTATIFSIDTGTLKDMTVFTSDQNLKNVAYVVSEQGSVIVRAPGTSSGVSSFNRRVLMVNLGSINLDDLGPNETLHGYLRARGRDALAENRKVTLHDGEINVPLTFEYGVDYELGDVVYLRDRDNQFIEKRVTEQIFTFDSTGFRSYPALANHPTD